MDLITQIQGIGYSFVYGIIFTFVYHFIIVTDTGKTVMLLLVYLLWAEFDEPLDYQYKVK